MSEVIPEDDSFNFDTNKRIKYIETESTMIDPDGGDSRYFEEGGEDDQKNHPMFSEIEENNDKMSIGDDNFAEESVPIDSSVRNESPKPDLDHLDAFADVVVSLEEKKNRLSQLKEEWQSRLESLFARLQNLLQEEQNRLQSIADAHLQPLEFEIASLQEWIDRNGKDHEKIDRAKDVLKNIMGVSADE
eukprot:GDKJ01014456.1.p1 GENE.GDKJ01014456.1~~GDKJ01014456.1.p1  ORF type:complete len:189 (+),score=58.55 GDKJ01014456.1:26-592(+)